MDFPRSKSWIEVRWTVEDPEGRVSGMMADLNLLIEGPAHRWWISARNQYGLRRAWKPKSAHRAIEPSRLREVPEIGSRQL